MKMVVIDQIEILDKKIKQNETQYDLYRKAAKISALFSNNLDKFKYLAGKDLGLEPSTIKQAKFEYSPLGKVFTKGLNKDDQKDGLFKRLKNIEDKTEELLKTTKNKTENIKEITDSFKESLGPEAKALIEEIRTIQESVDYKKLKIIGGNKVTYDFSDYKTFKELFRDLYYRNMTIDETEKKQNEFDVVLGALSLYSVKKKEYIEAKNKLLDNAKNFYYGRKKIIEGFKKGIFLLKSDDESPKKTTKVDVKEFNELIIKKEKDIDKEIFKKYLGFQTPSILLKNLYNLNDEVKKTMT